MVRRASERGEVMLGIERCKCGSVYFTINVLSNIATCNKCFRVIYDGSETEPVPKKIYRYGEERKIRVKWSALNGRGDKKGFGCCDYEEFVDWYKSVKDVCHYCSGEMKNINKKYGSIITIDRMDNNKGYFVGNMVKACWICNSTKGQFFTHDQMIKIAKLVLL